MPVESAQGGLEDTEQNLYKTALAGSQQGFFWGQGCNPHLLRTGIVPLDAQSVLRTALKPMYSNLKVEESTIVYRQELPDDTVISLQRIKPLASYHYEAKVISAADAHRKHNAVWNPCWGVTAEDAIKKAIKDFNSNS